MLNEEEGYFIFLWGLRLSLSTLSPFSIYSHFRCCSMPLLYYYPQIALLTRWSHARARSTFTYHEKKRRNEGEMIDYIKDPFLRYFCESSSYWQNFAKRTRTIGGNFANIFVKTIGYTWLLSLDQKDTRSLRTIPKQNEILIHFLIDAKMTPHLLYMPVCLCVSPASRSLSIGANSESSDMDDIIC